MARCPFCDTRNSPEAAVCSECGAELAPPTKRSPVPSSPGGESTSEQVADLSELDPFEQEIAGLLKEGQKIAAIKRYREKTGTDLKTAKDAVEAFARKHGLPQGTVGCGTASAALLLLVVSVYWWIL